MLASIVMSTMGILCLFVSFVLLPVGHRQQMLLPKAASLTFFFMGIMLLIWAA